MVIFIILFLIGTVFILHLGQKKQDPYLIFFNNYLRSSLYKRDFQILEYTITGTTTDLRSDIVTEFLYDRQFYKEYDLDNYFLQYKLEHITLSYLLDNKVKHELKLICEVNIETSENIQRCKPRDAIPGYFIHKKYPSSFYGYDISHKNGYYDDFKKSFAKEILKLLDQKYSVDTGKSLYANLNYDYPGSYQDLQYKAIHTIPQDDEYTPYKLVLVDCILDSDTLDPLCNFSELNNILDSIDDKKPYIHLQELVINQNDVNAIVFLNLLCNNGNFIADTKQKDNYHILQNNFQNCFVYTSKHTKSMDGSIKSDIKSIQEIHLSENESVWIIRNTTPEQKENEVMPRIRGFGYTYEYRPLVINKNENLVGIVLQKTYGDLFIRIFETKKNQYIGDYDIYPKTHSFFKCYQYGTEDTVNYRSSKNIYKENLINPSLPYPQRYGFNDFDITESELLIEYIPLSENDFISRNINLYDNTQTCTYSDLE